VSTINSKSNPNVKFDADSFPEVTATVSAVSPVLAFTELLLVLLLVLLFVVLFEVLFVVLLVVPSVSPVPKNVSAKACCSSSEP